MFKRIFSLMSTVGGKSRTAVLILIFAMVFIGSNCAFANINGAIFTTESICDGVNVNLFDSKMAVYLDGGPHKIGSAGLPDGYYCVQVTSPNGQLLGTTVGAADQKPVHVTNGAFDYCYQLWDILIKASNGSQGYDDTPNNGGVYKVWLTPANIFEQEGAFINAWCKTDNFKVKGEESEECPTPSVIYIHKFDDSDANGTKNIGENDINDWLINISDPCGSPSSGGTPVEILASPAGNWQICEDLPENWLQTALIIDGTPVEPAACAAVIVNDDCGEEHTVVFGNIQLGSMTACKFIDLNFNGINEAEPPLEGIRFNLSGEDVMGNVVDQNGVTGVDGCVTFDKLLPGSYTLCEVLPPNWTATTDTCQNISLTEGNDISFEFGNICTGTAEFGTKGYWHNKNGLNETVQADLDYLNTLAPWSTCNSNNIPFGLINGKYCNGSNIPAVKIGKKKIAVAGSAKAEQSLFLVYNNGNVKLQLAQQLDAFIMNVRHRLDECGPNTVIQKPDGTWVEASTLITQAVNCWIEGTVTQKTAMANLLDSLNNSSAVVFISCFPCDVIYPVVDVVMYP